MTARDRNLSLDLLAALSKLPVEPLLAALRAPDVHGELAKKLADVVAKQDQQLKDQQHELDRIATERVALLVDRDRLAEELDRADQERGRIAAEQDQLQQERDRLRLERDRLAAELRALRGARRELPRTAAELRAWREVRGLTQVEAAGLLKIGSATVARMEAKPGETPLGRVLLLALARDAEDMRVAAGRAGPGDARRGRLRVAPGVTRGP